MIDFGTTVLRRTRKQIKTYAYLVLAVAFTLLITGLMSFFPLVSKAFGEVTTQQTDGAAQAVVIYGQDGFGGVSQYTNDLEFRLKVNMGMVPGYSVIDKFGVNRVITTIEDVWEFGGEYNYDANGTAPIQYISSSDALDTGQTITVLGLDINGDEVSQVVTTDGQNNVTLGTALWRMFRLENDSDIGNDINGIIYGHTDPTPTNGVPTAIATRAIINGGNNQTLMALYTIPRGKVGFLYRGEIGVALDGNAAALAEYAIVQYKSRRYGKLFKVKKEITNMIGGGSSLYQDPRSFPDIIPALVDIKVVVTDVTTTMGAWAAFDILLVDEDKFPTWFLEAIGQPGY